MKKATVVVLTQEEFLTRIGIQLDSGLVLCTHHKDGRNLAWVGSEEKTKTISEFEQFIDQLISDGWEIEGRDILNEYR